VHRDGDRIGDARMAQDVVAAAGALDIPDLASRTFTSCLRVTAGVWLRRRGPLRGRGAPRGREGHPRA
jgi:hypothetical protein